jgi:type 1 fimbria pilin
MKYLIPCIVLTSTVAMGTAQADTGTIKFDGTINGATCSLSISSTTLTIGPVQQGVFNGLNSASPPSNVGTIATDPSCTASTVSMTFMANADPNDSTLFAVTGGASGVGIKLEGLNSGGVWQQAVPNSTTSPIVHTIGAQSFRARYVQSAATLVNGNANASITVLVTYT